MQICRPAGWRQRIHARIGTKVSFISPAGICTAAPATADMPVQSRSPTTASHSCPHWPRGLPYSLAVGWTAPVAGGRDGEGEGKPARRTMWTLAGRAAAHSGWKPVGHGRRAEGATDAEEPDHHCELERCPAVHQHRRGVPATHAHVKKGARVVCIAHNTRPRPQGRVRAGGGRHTGGRRR